MLGKSALKSGRRVKRLDHHHGPQRFLKSADERTQAFLAASGRTAQGGGDPRNEESRHGHEEQGKEGQFPADGEQGDQGQRDHDRRFEEHLEGADHAELHLHEVVGHPADEVALALLGEVPHGQGENAVKQLGPQVPGHPGPDGRQAVETQVGDQVLDEGEHRNGPAHDEEGLLCAPGGHERIEALRQPGEQRIGLSGIGRRSWRPRPKEDAQERHDGEEGEQRQDRSECVERDVARQVQAVTEDESEQVAEPPHAPVVPM